MLSETPTLKPRVEMVDALRGFAIMIIFIIHVQEHFNIFNFPDPAAQPAWLNNLDMGVFRIIFSLFAGKSYSIFALLFGFTFYIQYHNQELKGKDFGYRFLWRLCILGVFGFINSIFFPAGDILFIYAIVGIALFFVRKLRSRTILIIAVVLLAQPMEWIHFFISCFRPDYQLPDFHTGEMFAQVREYSLDAGTHPWQYFYKNIVIGMVANLSWTVSVGRILQTAGLFMIGFLIGRKQLFIANKESLRFWVYALIGGAILFNPLLELKNIFDVGKSDLIRGTMGVVFDMWQKFAFTFVIVSSFVLLYQTEAFRRLTSNLRFYGRMTMTNYIAQSLLGTFVFLPIGLNLGDKCGNTVSLLISIVMVCLQIAFCKWWLRSHRQGPLESVWHKLTWIGTDK